MFARPCSGLRDMDIPSQLDLYYSRLSIFVSPEYIADFLVYFHGPFIGCSFSDMFLVYDARYRLCCSFNLGCLNPCLASVEKHRFDQSHVYTHA